MVATNLSKETQVAQKKQFNIRIYKEKFYSYLRSDQVAEMEYMEKAKFHTFEVKGTSDDLKVQRWDCISASMAEQPKAGDLVVVEVGGKFRLERYPDVSGIFVATVVGAGSPL